MRSGGLRAAGLDAPRWPVRVGGTNAAATKVGVGSDLVRAAGADLDRARPLALHLGDDALDVALGDPAGGRVAGLLVEVLPGLQGQFVLALLLVHARGHGL